MRLGGLRGRKRRGRSCFHTYQYILSDGMKKLPRNPNCRSTRMAHTEDHRQKSKPSVCVKKRVSYLRQLAFKELEFQTQQYQQDNYKSSASFDNVPTTTRPSSPLRTVTSGVDARRWINIKCVVVFCSPPPRLPPSRPNFLSLLPRWSARFRCLFGDCLDFCLYRRQKRQVLLRAPASARDILRGVGWADKRHRQDGRAGGGSVRPLRGTSKRRENGG